MQWVLFDKGQEGTIEQLQLICSQIGARPVIWRPLVNWSIVAVNTPAVYMNYVLKSGLW